MCSCKYKIVLKLNHEASLCVYKSVPEYRKHSIIINFAASEHHKMTLHWF